MEYPFMKHPFSMLVCGPSSSGKTYFVKRVIDEKLIQPFPKRILWCYGIYQKLYNEMPQVEFYEGLPSNINQVSDALIVIDDLMSELGDDSKLSMLFTKGSHHRNLSVIFIVQNLFHHGKEMRNISLNVSYMCCFKNVRDKNQIMCLAKQMYPDKTKYFLESYNDATSKPYGYLFIDAKPDTDERLRLRNGIFLSDERKICYLPKDYVYAPDQSLPKHETYSTAPTSNSRENLPSLSKHETYSAGQSSDENNSRENLPRQEHLF